jgi:hypothetical protein
MRRLERAAAIALATVGISAVVAEAAQAPVRDSKGRRARAIHASVTPPVGAPDVRFVVQFKARNEAQGRVFYDIEATGPEPADFRDCDNDTSIFRHARRGTRVRVHIPSRRTQPRWCAGRYVGVVFLEDWRGGPGREREKVVGRFRVEVRARNAPAARSAPRAARGASGTASRAGR